MALAEKQNILRNVEKQLGSSITVNDMIMILDVLSKELSKYEVQSIESNDNMSESEDYLNAFLDAKTIEGCAKGTIKLYRYKISRLLNELKIPVNEITVYHLRSQLMSMRNRKLADKTIENDRAIYSSFFQWLHKEGLISIDPTSNIATIKCEKKIRLPLSAVDIKRLEECCKNSKDKALISFLLATGCRVSEVCKMDRENVDFQNLECMVHGKGNKERMVYIDNVTAMLLKRYLKEREDDNPALFVTRTKKRISQRCIQVFLKEIGQRAGVENVHPHRFRRTLATNLINHGMPLQEVARVLGHENINTTLTYVYIEKDNVRNAYRKYA